MKFAVFLRNVNLGRPFSPSRVQFEQAFLDAGAIEAASFLVNGTLVFAASPRRANAIVRNAVTALAHDCGLREPAFLRRVDALAQLVADDPFAAIDRTGVHDCCVTFLSAGAVLPPLPLSSTRGDASVFARRDDDAFGICRQLGSSPASPNPLIEKASGAPATTRSWNTIVRLVARHG